MTSAVAHRFVGAIPRWKRARQAVASGQRTGGARSQGVPVLVRHDGALKSADVRFSVRVTGSEGEDGAASSSVLRHALYSLVPAGLYITHMSPCVRSGCKRSPWRGLPACVEASSPPPSGLAVAAGAQAQISCNIPVYAQGSHACLTDAMIGTIPSSTPVTRMGNSMPRAGSRARLARQHGCRTPHRATHT